jgi:hypothetical protein
MHHLERGNRCPEIDLDLAALVDTSSLEGSICYRSWLVSVDRRALQLAGRRSQRTTHNPARKYGQVRGTLSSIESVE